MKNVITLIALKIALLIMAISMVVYFMLDVKAAELKPFEGTTPPLILSSLSDELIDLKQYKGKLTMVQFWATYCTPCRVEMPSMNRLQAKMGSDFAILAVNMGETVDEVQQFVDEVKPQFTILLDEDGNALSQWKVFAAPATFIIDPAGEIRYTLFGATEWDSDMMIAQLQSLM